MPILHSGSDALEPVWVNGGIGSSNATRIHVDEYGRRQIQENGNNGAFMSHRLKGMARGQFSIHFVGSNLWGWAGVLLIVPDNFNHDACSYTTATPAGKPHITLYTNGSNNLTFASYWNGSTASGNLNQITAINGATLRITRDSSNVIKWYNGSSENTIGTMSDDFIVRSNNQSPCWTRILQAYNINPS